LQLRFSLVGGLFDTISRSVASITDWCTLLVQVSNGHFFFLLWTAAGPAC
jgi:hypothetical protein